MSQPYSEEAKNLAAQLFSSDPGILRQIEQGTSSLASDAVKSVLSGTTQILFNVAWVRSLPPNTGERDSARRADDLLKLYKLMKKEEETAVGL